MNDRADGRWTRRGVAVMCSTVLALSTVRADRLGEERLFFTSAERAGSAATRREDEGAGDETLAADSRGARSDPSMAAVPPVSSRRAGDPSGDRSATTSPGTESRELTTARSRPGVDALLRVGDRVRVVVGGQPCRAVAGGATLHCGRVPAIVAGLALASDGRAVIVTLADGRRRRVAVGDGLVP